MECSMKQHHYRNTTWTLLSYQKAADTWNFENSQEQSKLATVDKQAHKRLSSALKNHSCIKGYQNKQDHMTDIRSAFSKPAASHQAEL